MPASSLPAGIALRRHSTLAPKAAAAWSSQDLDYLGRKAVEILFVCRDHELGNTLPLGGGIEQLSPTRVDQSRVGELTVSSEIDFDQGFFAHASRARQLLKSQHQALPERRGCAVQCFQRRPMGRVFKALGCRP